MRFAGRKATFVCYSWFKDLANLCQNKVLTSLLPLALIRGNVALVSVLMGCEPRGVSPSFFLNRKSTLDVVMA